MSAYNTVSIKRLVPCRRCGDTGEIKVQFAYGDTQQHSYAMGDKISWGATTSAFQLTEKCSCWAPRNTVRRAESIYRRSTYSASITGGCRTTG